METRASDDERSRHQAERWVRLACWIGAVTDAGAAVQMLVPRVFAFAYRPSTLPAGPDFGFAMRMGASLMLGWTVLLLWAARRPLERRGVLLLTVVPVIVGLVLNEVVGVMNGFLPAAPLAPVWTLQAALVVLFVVAHEKAERAVAAR